MSTATDTGTKQRLWRAYQPEQGPDTNIHPCHPVGTWQRALLFQSLGFHATPEDLAALSAWDSRPPPTRRATGAADYRRRNKMLERAVEVLEPDEVVSIEELADRLEPLASDMDRHQIETHLRSTDGYTSPNPRRRPYRACVVDGEGRHTHIFSNNYNQLAAAIVSRRPARRTKRGAKK